MNRNESTDLLICDRDVAKMLGCSVPTIWRYAAKGVIKRPIKIGGKSRWTKSEIEAVIEQAKAEREAVGAVAA